MFLLQSPVHEEEPTSTFRIDCGNKTLACYTWQRFVQLVSEQKLQEKLQQKFPSITAPLPRNFTAKHSFGSPQDFALDPEESRMRAAAHHMVRFMTAGMALITCREPLLISINNNLRSNFLAALRVRMKLFSSCILP